MPHAAAIRRPSGCQSTRPEHGQPSVTPSEAHAAIIRAEDAWERAQADDLDQLGVICTFGRSRQLYYAADD
jgi:hypothetical protein